jgi:glycosyltransferase involved in cell wall biosynthesis
VGIVGRLVPIKDVSLFIEIARRVREVNPTVGFVIAGDGELREQLKLESDHAGGDIRFMGWVEDLPTLYRALDLVVLTSRNEGTPFSLIEASAASRAIVAADVGGVREVVVDGRTGTLIRARDPDLFARAIVEGLADTARSDVLGEQGREHVAERFAGSNLVGRLVTLYHELLDRKAPSRL